jgi:hypothetical protein
VGAGTVHDQLGWLLGALNAHTGSGDHDGRYARLTYSNGQIYSAGQTVRHGDIKGWPAIVTCYPAVAGPNNQLGSFSATGPLNNQIVASVTKNINNSGFQLSVQNASAQNLYVLVNVYRVGS